MEIVAIKIENFKGIKDLYFKIDESVDVYTLIGLNESGKTTVLEAINETLNTEFGNEIHKLIPKSEKYSFSGIIKLSIEFNLNPNDINEIKKYIKNKGYSTIEVGRRLVITKEYKFFKSEKKGKSNIWSIALRVKKGKQRDFRRLFSEDTKVWQDTTTFIQNNLLPNIVYYTNFLFEFPERIYLNADDYSEEVAEHKKYVHVVQDILSSIEPGLTIKEHIVDRLENGSDESEEYLDLLIDQMGTTVSDIVSKSWEKLFPNTETKIFIKLGKEKREENIVYYLQFKLKDGKELFSISERSLGFRWFFSFILFTEFRKNRTSEKSKVLFLLDEPASNLHPTAQINLLKNFEGLLDKSKLIYSTHSHFLINPNWLYGAYIVNNKKLSQKDTAIETTSKADIEIIKYKNFVGKYSNQREYMQPILDKLDYRPGLLEKVPNIVITEGKNDFFTFSYILNLYFNEKYDVRFYPGGGANSDELLIKLYESWGKEYFVLRDSDTAGVKAIEQYKKRFPKLLDGKCYSYKDIDINFDSLVLEDFFSASEKEEITKMFDDSETGFNKGKFNAQIQILLSQKHKIQLSDETLDNFKKVFDFFKDKLSDG